MEYMVKTLRELCMNIENIAEPQFDFAYKTFANLIPVECLKMVKKIIVTGCGDSYIAAAEAKAAFDKYLAGTDCKMLALRIVEASRYFELGDNEPDTMVVAVSVSGGPARISEVLMRGRKHGCITVALTNKADSRAAMNADYVYLTNTTPDSPGLCSYYASMLSLFVMAVAIGEAKKGTSGEMDILREKLLEYHKTFFEDFDAIDAVCKKTAGEWADSVGFEVVADGPLLSCGEFIAAKYAEAAGEKCTYIDSENYMHVNGLLCPTNGYGTIAMAVSDEPNMNRIADTINMMVSRQNRSVMLVCDKDPSEVGITQPVVLCKVRVPEKDYRFLFLLYSFIPGALMAGYQAELKNVAYFRRTDPVFIQSPNTTIASSEITII